MRKKAKAPQKLAEYRLIRDTGALGDMSILALARTDTEKPRGVRLYFSEGGRLVRFILLDIAGVPLALGYDPSDQ